MGSLVNRNIENSNKSKKLLGNVNSSSSGALFKIRKVSATRVFPPRCGPNAPRMYALPRIAKEKKRTDKKFMNVSASKSNKLVTTIPMITSIHKESLNERLLTYGVSFKKHKISATRVFPPGCGPNAPHMYVSPRYKKEKAGADEKQVAFAMSDCSESPDDENASMLDKSTRIPMNMESNDQVETSVVKSITNTVTEDKDVLENRKLFENAKNLIPSHWPISTIDILRKSLLKIECKERKISAMRKFPPFCGRNARRPTKEERLEMMGGYGT